MTSKNNAAKEAVGAAALPAESAVVWVPCLLIDAGPLPCGIETSHQERLPGAFDTQREAMEAAEKLARQHPDAIGYSAKRVEVAYGL